MSPFKRFHYYKHRACLDVAIQVMDAQLVEDLAVLLVRFVGARNKNTEFWGPNFVKIDRKDFYKWVEV